MVKLGRWQARPKQSNMSDISEEGFWYKARYTPLRDVLCGKLTARLDLHRELERALWTWLKPT
jgi:hypothetical protein